VDLRFFFALQIKEVIMLRIAVASSDGVTINEHFGQARQFLVFEVKDDGAHRQIEVRAIAGDGGSCSSSEHSHENVIAHLEGVDVVFASQIGPGAVYSLQTKGIRAFGVKGPLDKALVSYGKRHRFLEQSLASGGHSCGSGGGCGGKGCK
jgi:nitrogen fixation protein NifB